MWRAFRFLFLFSMNFSRAKQHCWAKLVDTTQAGKVFELLTLLFLFLMLLPTLSNKALLSPIWNIKTLFCNVFSNFWWGAEVAVLLAPKPTIWDAYVVPLTSVKQWRETRHFPSPSCHRISASFFLVFSNIFFDPQSFHFNLTFFV